MNSMDPERILPGMDHLLKACSKVDEDLAALGSSHPNHLATADKSNTHQHGHQAVPNSSHGDPEILGRLYASLNIALEALDIVEAAESCEALAAEEAAKRGAEYTAEASSARVELALLQAYAGKHRAEENGIMYEDDFDIHQEEGGSNTRAQQYGLFAKCADWASREKITSAAEWEEENSALENELAQLKSKLTAESVKAMDRIATAKVALRNASASGGGLWMDSSSKGAELLDEDLVRRKF
jgi:hypothetical protein